MYSPVFLSNPTTSGSPPVLSISLSDHSFSALASSFACTLSHSKPLWRFMFCSKRAFNALSSSSRCSGDKSFLLLLMFRALVALIVVASRVSYLLLRCAPPHGFFSACLCVLINSQFPRRSECTRQYILARRQAHMRVSHLSPAARNRQENLGCLLHKRCLLLQRKHQISVALCLRRERSKFPTSYTKSRQSRVRVLFHAFQAQGNPAKICCGHVAIPIRQREYRISPLADGMCLPLGGGSRATWKAASGLPTNHPECLPPRAVTTA